MSQEREAEGWERLLDLRRGAVARWSTVLQGAYVARARVGTLRLSAVTVTSISSLRVAVWLAGLCLFCLVYFAPHNDANQNAHTDLTVAIVDHGTVAIDPYARNTIDQGLYKGHYYVLKAPGLSLLNIPVYLLYKASFAVRGGLPANPADDPQLRYLESVCMDAIPVTLFLLLFFWFLGYFSSSLVNRALLTLALGLGTILFPYGQNFFSHVPVAILLFSSFVLLYILLHPNAARGSGSRWLVDRPELTAMLIGLALGLVVLTEYDGVVVAACIAIYALVRLPRRLLPYLLVGGAPPLMVLLAYNYAAYGNPFKLAYTSGAAGSFSGVYSQGTGGFIWPPTRDALWGLSFSPFRGLLFLSPFLLLAFPGFGIWAKRGGSEWRLCLVIVLAYFLFISMFVTWDGGWAVGPRYLIPMIPFLALPIIFTLDGIASWRVSRDVAGMAYGLVYLLVFFSIVAVWGESIAGNTPLWPDESNQNVLFSANLPALLQGSIMPDLGTIYFGLAEPLSLFLLLTLLAVWSLAVFAPPAIQWANLRSGWLPPGTQPSWAAWRHRATLIPSVARVLNALQRLQMSLRLLSAGPSPAPALAGAETGVRFQPEYALLRLPDTGWQLALWLTIGLRAGLALLGSWAVIAHGATVAGGWTNLIIQSDKSWSDVLSFGQRWDALWYQQIAENGYHAGDGTYMFGPLYPLLVHVVSLVLGGAPVVAELIVSSIAFAVAMFLVYCLARLVVGPLTAALAVLLLALFPSGFLLLVPDSVGLLLALTALAFWLAQRDRPWLAGIAGFAGALTEPVGVIIMLPLVLELVQRRRAQGKPLGLELLSAGLPILGLLLFNAYLRIVVGETHWYMPWSRLSHLPYTPIIPRGDPLEVLNIVGLVAFAVLTIVAARWLPLSYVAYAAVLLGMLAGSEIAAPLTGIAHYALLLFPCYLVPALWLVRRPSLLGGWITISTLLQALLLMMWVRFVFLG